MTKVIDFPKEEEFTVCIKCVHFHNKERHSPREHVWYNHVCKAVKRKKVKDPYDGKMRYGGVNDLGTVYTTDDPYRYCRDINNDGKCKYYIGYQFNNNNIYTIF
jgi:hypothetical protein